MWSDIQNAPKAQFGQVGWRMPGSIRQGERIPYKCIKNKIIIITDLIINTIIIIIHQIL